MQTHGQKGWGKKIGTIVQDVGGIAGAVAGNVDLGTAAFQGLERKAAEGPLDFTEIEKLVRESYEENVFGNPIFTSDPLQVWYSLLLGVRFDDESPKLFVTGP